MPTQKKKNKELKDLLGVERMLLSSSPLWKKTSSLLDLPQESDNSLPSISSSSSRDSSPKQQQQQHPTGLDNILGSPSSILGRFLRQPTRSDLSLHNTGASGEEQQISSRPPIDGCISPKPRKTSCRLSRTVSREESCEKTSEGEQLASPITRSLSLFKSRDENNEMMSSPSPKQQSSRMILGRLMFRRNSSSLTNMKDFEETEETKRLENCIANTKQRKQLVDSLLSSHSPNLMKIRFISAMIQYQETENKKERALKGKKIAETFVQTTSVFHLDGIPSDLEQDALNRNETGLAAVKLVVLNQLVDTDSAVKQFLLAESLAEIGMEQLDLQNS